VIPWPRCETFWVLGSPCACPTSLAAFTEVKCVSARGGAAVAGWRAPMGHQQHWQSQDASLGGPMGGPMAGAAHDAKASIEGVDLLPSRGRDGPWAGGAGRGQGSGVEWSGLGERERRAREARPPGKATYELVQLRHSSVLLLQFARLRLRCCRQCRHIIRWCPRCQTQSVTRLLQSPVPSTTPSTSSLRTSSPRTALLRTTEDGCCSLDRL